MFETLKTLLEFEEYVPPSISVNNGTNSSNNILQPSSQNIFGNERAATGMGGTGELTAAAVGNYLDKAAQINDGVECVGFAIELDDGDLVKVYVDKNHAVDFENAISTAMGGDASFEDILLQVANDYDVVDVVWPNNQYGTNPESGPQPADDAANTAVTPPDVPAETPSPTELAPADAEGDAQDDDPTELKGSISQKTTPTPKLDAEPSSDPVDIDEPSEPTTDVGTDVDGEKSSMTGDAEGSKDGSTDPVSTEQSDSVDGEQPTEAETEQSSSEQASTDGEEGSGDDSKESKPSSDDGISVTIHRKKKSTTSDSGEPPAEAPFKESLEEAPTTNAQKRPSDMFKALNLSSHFSAAGSQAQNLIGKRILVIIGYIGIPGDALTKVPNFMDSINAAAVSINNNAGAKTAFNQVYNIITSTPKQDKTADAQYRGEFKAFLQSIGFDTTSIGDRADVIQAILFGAHCMNAAPTNKIKFRTFADKINAKSE